MNTSSVGARLDHLHPFQPFDGAGLTALANRAVAVPLNPADRLARIVADRDLILSDLKGTPAPPFAPMPAISAGTSVVVATLELPLHGYATGEGDEPMAHAGPVAPDLLDRAASAAGDGAAATPAIDGSAGAAAGAEGAPDSGVQGLVAANSTGTSVTKRELAFLDDKSLSIEEKLFQFMVLMTRKGDQELVAAMKQAEGKRGTSSSSSSGSSSGSASSSGSGSSGGTGSSTGATSGSSIDGTPSTSAGESDEDSGLLGDVESLVRDHTGDVLALGATALGFPELAPIGKLAGPIVGKAIDQGIEWAGSAISDVGGAVEDGLGAIGGFVGGIFGGSDDPAPAPVRPARTGASSIGGGVQDAAEAVAAQVDQAVGDPAAASATSSASGASSKSSASSTSSSSSGGSETLDEKLVMFNLERAVQKQNEMFAALSNILKSFDDTKMSIIQNLR